jgi:leucyl/phenylalanyl-tRNA---protein transferase
MLSSLPVKSPIHDDETASITPNFPPTFTALQDPNGLLALGGSVSPDWLLAAYERGIFPWYSRGQPIMWWTPNPRLVLMAQDLRVNARLLQRMRALRWEFRADHQFAGVLRACAAKRKGQSGTWLTSELQRSLRELHQAGVAHSLEVFDDEQRIAGIYGLALGRVFFAESMFGHVSDASKLALIALSVGLDQLGFALMDCQVRSAHLMDRGAKELSREQFELHLGQKSIAWPRQWPVANTQALADALLRLRSLNTTSVQTDAHESAHESAHEEAPGASS